MFALFLLLYVIWTILIANIEQGANLRDTSPGITSIVLSAILPLFGLRTLFREGQQLWVRFT